MRQQSVPTAEARSFTDYAAAEEYVRKRDGDVVIKDAEGKVVETVEMDSSPIHPQAAVKVAFPIQPLREGEYSMEIHLKVGSKILVKEAVVEVASAR